ncbi:hypothetical protein OH76DRAFT_1481572 [Lentinus brumalis]|uniref:Uncharacterized protein n=1 Tax=Lentinus brumalis TaxID=2498619 RepID=A0A371DFF5_9APHY|nr:hypothetical protein OH76DRAFT_1481572 [Polyporus brumalis]
MAQRPTDSLPYTYGARAFIRSDVLTRLPYKAPQAPSVVDATPTILRCFYDDPPVVKQEPAVGRVRSALRASSVASGATTPASSRASSPASSVGSLATFPPPSPAPSSRGVTPTSSIRGADTRRGSVNLRATSVPPVFHAGSSNPSPVSKILTRSASRSSLRSESIPPHIASSSAGTTVTNQPTNMDPTTSRRIYKWCHRTDEEKKKGLRFQTGWFPSYSPRTLPEPPAVMSTKDGLTETDLFCHWTPQSTVPEMWSWERAGDGMMYWKPVSEGHVRDADQRVLSFTPGGEPSYIRAEWHRRRLREREAAAKAAVKRGKARAHD